MVARLYLLVQDAEVRYLDAVANKEDDGMHGRVVALTPDRICMLDLKGTRGVDYSGDARSTASARSWARRSLISVTIPASSDGSVNSDSAWENLPDDLVPAASRIEFRYDSGDCLTLPLAATKEQRKRLATVLPGLLRDLGDSAHDYQYSGRRPR